MSPMSGPRVYRSTKPLTGLYGCWDTAIRTESPVLLSLASRLYSHRLSANPLPLA